MTTQELFPEARQEWDAELLKMEAKSWGDATGRIAFELVARTEAYNREVLSHLRDQLIEEALTAEKEELAEGVYYDTVRDLTIQISLVEFVLSMLPLKAA